MNTYLYILNQWWPIVERCVIDGANVTASDLNGVNNQVKRENRQVVFIHCVHNTSTWPHHRNSGHGSASISHLWCYRADHIISKLCFSEFISLLTLTIAVIMLVGQVLGEVTGASLE